MVFVGDLEGWEQSTGVQAEVEYAKSIGKEIYLINHKNGEILKQL